MPTPSTKHRGWYFDRTNSRLDAQYNGSRAAHVDASGLTVPSGKTLAVDGTITATGAVDLSGATSVTLPAATMRVGFIDLPLANWRLIASSDIPALAIASGGSGILALDTVPDWERVNDATDKALRITWATTEVIPITTAFTYPPDLDDTAVVTVNLLMAKGSNTDTTATVGVAYFEGVGDANAGGNTAAFAASTLAVKTVVIAAADIGAYPMSAVVEITPGTHGNDTFLLYGAWITYTRKTA